MSRAAALKARATLRAKRLAKLAIPAADPQDPADFSVCQLCHQLRDRPHSCLAIDIARGVVAEVADVKVRTWGAHWVEYCVGNIAKRPARLGLDVRALELRLSQIGVVDPAGFEYGVDNVRGRKSKRAPVGKLPEDLARWLEQGKRSTYNG